MKKALWIGTLLFSTACAQFDTSTLVDNRWVNVWPMSKPFPINSNKWTYENDFQSHPFHPFFILAPGHSWHPQDSYWFPYDPRTDKWSTINMPVRSPRACLSSFVIHAQDTTLIQWGGAEHSHQLSQGAFTAGYNSIDFNGSRGSRIWAWEFNRNRWHHMKGPSELPPNSFSRFPEYDPVHDISINAKGNETWVYNFHNNRAVRFGSITVFGEYGYANAVDSKRGLFYVLNGGTWCFDPESGAWSAVATGTPLPGPWATWGANSPQPNCMDYDPRHDILLYLGDEANPAGLPACRSFIFHCDTKAWEEISPLASPRDQGRLAYNRSLNMFMMLGGETDVISSRGAGMGIWFYRYGSDNPAEQGMAQAPEASVSTAGGSPAVSWNAVEEAGVSGYNLYRGTAWPYPKGFMKLNASPVTVLSFTDASASASTHYSYRVCAVKEGVEGHLSRHCYTAPGRVLGTVASVEESTVVKVSWYANPESDIAGYNIYRARGADIYNTAAFNYVKINGSPVPVAQYLDTLDLSDGIARGYVVRAVNAWGQESGNSEECTTFPNPPEWAWGIPQNTANGLKMALRWQPPERTKILGVRLYSGPNGAPVSPAATLITDTGATFWNMPANPGGTTTYELQGAAYFVRAVNLLGQEGFLTDQFSPVLISDFGYGIVPAGGRFNYDSYKQAATELETPAPSSATPGIRLTARPNPFNASTTILLDKGMEAGEAGIFDLSGRLVKSFTGGRSFSWDAREAPSGVYIIRARINGRVVSRNLIRIR